MDTVTRRVAMLGGIASLVASGLASGGTRAEAVNITVEENDSVFPELTGTAYEDGWIAAWKWAADAIDQYEAWQRGEISELDDATLVRLRYLQGPFAEAVKTR